MKHHPNLCLVVLTFLTHITYFSLLQGAAQSPAPCNPGATACPPTRSHLLVDPCVFSRYAIRHALADYVSQLDRATTYTSYAPDRPGPYDPKLSPEEDLQEMCQSAALRQNRIDKRKRIATTAACVLKSVIHAVGSERCMFENPIALPLGPLITTMLWQEHQEWTKCCAAYDAEHSEEEEQPCQEEAIVDIYDEEISFAAHRHPERFERLTIDVHTPDSPRSCVAHESVHVAHKPSSPAGAAPSPVPHKRRASGSAHPSPAAQRTEKRSRLADEPNENPSSATSAQSAPLSSLSEAARLAHVHTLDSPRSCVAHESVHMAHKPSSPTGAAPSPIPHKRCASGSPHPSPAAQRTEKRSRLADEPNENLSSAASAQSSPPSSLSEAGLLADEFASSSPWTAPTHPHYEQVSSLLHACRDLVDTLRGKVITPMSTRNEGQHSVRLIGEADSLGAPEGLFITFMHALGDIEFDPPSSSYPLCSAQKEEGEPLEGIIPPLIHAPQQYGTPRTPETARHAK